MTSMTFEKYQELAIQTKAPDVDDYLHSAMGLVTEVAELVDAYKKHWFYGKPLDMVNIKEEVGDILWYIALGHHANGTTLAVQESMFDSVNISYILKRLVAGAEFYYSSPEAFKGDTKKKDLYRCLFNLTAILHAYCKAVGISLSECAEMNIVKLAKRYPNKFEKDAALIRNVEHELSHIT